ncbi:MAG: hypothetical protein PHR16_13290 [Methylovulum sp.]|nr:hypothetical protein [Methylovulum sp.]
MTTKNRGRPITTTAEQAATTRTTVYSWLKNDDAFIAYFNGLKSEIQEAARAAIQSKAALAIETIADLMTGSENDAVRLAAAKEVLVMAGVSKPVHIGSDSPDKLRKGRAMDNLLDF